MKYTLKRHEEDSCMIAATTKLTVTHGSGVYLAFVIHEDMLGEAVKTTMDLWGAVEVSMKIDRPVGY